MVTKRPMAEYNVLYDYITLTSQGAKIYVTLIFPVVPHVVGGFISIDFFVIGIFKLQSEKNTCRYFQNISRTI